MTGASNTFKLGCRHMDHVQSCSCVEWTLRDLSPAWGSRSVFTVFRTRTRKTPPEHETDILCSVVQRAALSLNPLGFKSQKRHHLSANNFQELYQVQPFSRTASNDRIWPEGARPLPGRENGKLTLPPPDASAETDMGRNKRPSRERPSRAIRVAPGQAHRWRNNPPPQCSPCQDH